MREAVIKYKNGSTKVIKVEGTIEVPTIFWTDDIIAITCHDRRGAFQLMILKEIE